MKKSARALRGAFAFLTIIPVGASPRFLDEAAAGMHYFPLVGALIGMLAGAFACVSLQLFPPLVAGMLVVGFIELLTGLNHVDGLFDFGDGLMTFGSREAKLKAMRDEHVGAGGICLGIFVILLTAFCIAELEPVQAILSLMVAESLAKFAMVLQAYAGFPAYGGTGAKFVRALRRRHGRFAFAAGCSLCIALALGIPGLASLTSAACASLLVLLVANRTLGGLTGDVFGATNEIARTSCLLALLAG